MKITLCCLLIISLLAGCELTSNVSDSRIIGTSANGPIIERTIDGHDYININSEYTHSGTCRKCKHERDSVVNLIIENIKNK